MEILDLKNTIAEVKTTMGRLNAKIDVIEEIVSKQQDGRIKPKYINNYVKL